MYILTFLEIAVGEENVFFAKSEELVRVIKENLENGSILTNIVEVETEE